MQQNSKIFNDTFLKEFWDDCDYSKENYISEFPTDEIILKVEKEIKYKLPKSYIEFMKSHNGGLVKKTCFKTTEPTIWADDHIAIRGIYGIGFDNMNSLGGEFGSRFWIEDGWEYPDIGVAICDCPSAGHTMVFLDYRECGKNGEPTVVYIDQEDNEKIIKLADSFEEFILGLVDEDEIDIE